MEIKSNVLMQRYEVGRLLGQGAFAKVYYARSILNGQSVAIKVIDKEKVLKVGLMDQIKREISVMAMVRHPNIVYLYEVMASKTKIYFVIEFAKGGELFDKLTKARLKEDVAQKYFRQLINAVEFCHNRGVFHRDLKPENLLLDENENLKISDFGLSALVDCKKQDGLLHTTCGTPAYVAPEIITRKGYDGVKTDIWSCGVILFVLLAGYLPFHDSNLMEMYRKIGRAQYKCPSWFPKDARRLLGKILNPNPDSRITIAKIKESSWFRKDLSRKPVASESDVGKVSDAGTDGDPGPSSSFDSIEESRQDQIKPAELNAFDIISLSCRFDLSGLIDDCCHKTEARFTSKESASVIMSRLIEMSKNLRFEAIRMDKGLLKFESATEGKKGTLSFDADIFVITSDIYMVEMRKTNGDTLEYQKLLKEAIRPAIEDIVWSWQGDNQQQQPLFEEAVQNQPQS